MHGKGKMRIEHFTFRARRPFACVTAGRLPPPCKLPLQAAPCNKNFPMTFQGKYCILGSRADTLTTVAAEGWRIVS